MCEGVQADSRRGADGVRSRGIQSKLNLKRPPEHHQDQFLRAAEAHRY